MYFWVLPPNMQVIAWLFTYKLYNTLVTLKVSEEKTHILPFLSFWNCKENWLLEKWLWQFHANSNSVGFKIF